MRKRSEPRHFFLALLLFFLLIIGAFLKCAIAKVGFEKNDISQGFEALARAQCLLRSKISLGKMMLLSQVTFILAACFYLEYDCN